MGGDALSFVLPGLGLATPIAPATALGVVGAAAPVATVAATTAGAAAGGAATSLGTMAAVPAAAGAAGYKYAETVQKEVGDLLKYGGQNPGTPQPPGSQDQSVQDAMKNARKKRFGKAATYLSGGSSSLYSGGLFKPSLLGS